MTVASGDNKGVIVFVDDLFGQNSRCCLRAGNFFKH